MDKEKTKDLSEELAKLHLLDDTLDLEEVLEKVQQEENSND